MYKINNIFIKKNIFIILFLILVIFIILFLFVKNYKSLGIESFIESNTAAAFAIPTLKKWSFTESDNWYKVKPKDSSYQIPFKDLGFTMPNSVISISFLFNIVGMSDKWREIFRFNDGTSNDCCNKGDRVPALFIWPDNTSKLTIAFSTDTDGNEYITAPTILPMTTPVLITLVFNDNNFKLYVNNNLSYSGDFNNIYKRSDKAILYIGDNLGNYGADGNILIKNFTVYDGALTDSDVTNIYNKLEELPVGTIGPSGAQGVPGAQGAAGAQGLQGASGAPGTPGLQGLPGTPGLQGTPGAVGEIGSQGLQGIQGIQGEIGIQGIQGEIGPAGNTTTSTSSSNNKSKTLKFEQYKI